ncbi:MAG: hypothetical protein E6Q36_04230 [Chryseobacterium sp.]|nr:MAG: hypothetical protein E6Q36_04230 [Chryseobacterium sp.]
MTQYRFAELIESVAQATLDCYVGETFNSNTVAKIQADMRDRFKRMFEKIGNPISNKAAEWLADEHLKCASPNGDKSIADLNILIKSVSLTELTDSDKAMLRKLLPTEISIIGSQLA